jgi:hypothetical protein
MIHEVHIEINGSAFEINDPHFAHHDERSHSDLQPLTWA